MRRILDGLFTAIALIFIVPTSLILLSWNAIPGDSLYPLKRSLENITLLVLSGTPLVPKASIQFTDRRLNEATTLLAKKGSSVGYSLLVAQAKQTQGYIVSKNDKADSAAFIQNINTYQQKIEQTRQTVIAQANASGTALPPTLVSPAPIPATVSVPPTPAPIQQAPGVPLPAPTSPPVAQQISVTTSQTVVVAQENPQQVLQNLNQTQSQLEQIKKDLEQDQEGNGGAGQGKGHGQGQGD